LLSDYTSYAAAVTDFSLNLPDMELDVLLGQILDEHQAISLEVQMPLRWIPPAEYLQIRVNPYYFTRIMANLLHNAFQHGTPGHPVTVAAVPSSEGLSVTVKNHSSKIPENSLDRIFDLFYTTSPSPSGDPSPIRLNHSGLGLFIAKKLAESMRGALSAVNDGDGICFTLYLPQSRLQPDSAADRTH
jgi:signal transduction histidine kinase